MKLNIISDLHCGKSSTGEIVWNYSHEKDSIDINIYLQKLYNIKQYVEDNKEYSKQFDGKTYDKWVEIKFKSCDEFLSFLDKEIDFLSKQKNKNFSFNVLKHHTDVINSIQSYLQYCTKCTNYSLFDIRRLYLLKMYSFDPKKLKKADYLIIAGDLGLDGFYDEVCQQLKSITKNKFKDIFYIKGNHDYWCFPEYNNDVLRDDINFDHRFLEKEIGDYLILGCTMFAPVKKNPYGVKYGMNDYRYTPNLTIDKTNEYYNYESNWLRTKVQQNPNKKIIIVTHHLPRKELIEKKFYHSSSINEAYAVMDGSCDDIKPLVWISGHSHSHDDQIIDGVRYIRNPIGYRAHYGYLPSEVDPIHWYNTVIEV